MTFNNTSLLGVVFCLAVSSLFFTQDASAQALQYYYPAQSYQVPQRSARFFTSPSPSSTRSYRPVGGKGSNLHRNFTIRQEQLRSQRTGLPPRNRGNVRWIR